MAQTGKGKALAAKHGKADRMKDNKKIADRVAQGHDQFAPKPKAKPAASAKKKAAAPKPKAVKPVSPDVKPKAKPKQYVKGSLAQKRAMGSHG